MELVREYLNDSEDDQNAYQEELNAAALATPAHIMIEEEQKIEEEKDHGERNFDEIEYHREEKSDSDSDKECLA